MSRGTQATFCVAHLLPELAGYEFDQNPNHSVCISSAHGFPTWSVLRPRAGKAIHAQVTQRGLAGATNRVKRVRRNANQVTWLDRMVFGAVLTDLQCARPFEHVKDLLCVVMDMQRRRPARLDHDDKGFDVVDSERSMTRSLM